MISFILRVTSYIYVSKAVVVSFAKHYRDYQATVTQSRRDGEGQDWLE